MVPPPRVSHHPAAKAFSPIMGGTIDRSASHTTFQHKPGNPGFLFAAIVMSVSGASFCRVLMPDPRRYEKRMSKQTGLRMLEIPQRATVNFRRQAASAAFSSWPTPPHLCTPITSAAWFANSSYSSPGFQPTNSQENVGSDSSPVTSSISCFPTCRLRDEANVWVFG